MGQVAKALAKIHKPEPSEYTERGETFLHNIGATFKAEFVEHGEHFVGETKKRDIYEITFTRGKRELKLRFGQSIMKSGIVHAWGLSCDTIRHNGVNCVLAHNLAEVPVSDYDARQFKVLERREEPSAFAVLTAITLNDPGTFEDFCFNMGMDADSKKAEKIYDLVQEEWANVQIMFSDEELEVLREMDY